MKFSTLITIQVGNRFKSCRHLFIIPSTPLMIDFLKQMNYFHPLYVDLFHLLTKNFYLLKRIWNPEN